jgi:hypothetical protein
MRLYKYTVPLPSGHFVEFLHYMLRNLDHAVQASVAYRYGI